MTKLKHDPDFIKSQLVETKSGQLLTKSAAVIQFPKRYLKRNMAEIGQETFVFGIYALIMDGKYSITLTPAMMRVSPSRISEELIDDVEYTNFHFDANTVMIENVMLVREDTMVYSIMEEFQLKGNIPWYIDHESLAKIYDKTKRFANSDVAKNYAVMEAIAAFITRSADDKAIQYRHVVKTTEDMKKHKPSYIGMYGNVFYATPGTVGKLAGSYFQNGVVSALVQESETSSHVEQLLRT